MLEASAEIFERIGQALHRAHDGIVHEPVPERWIDLINRWNAEEDAQRLKEASEQLREQHNGCNRHS